MGTSSRRSGWGELGMMIDTCQGIGLSISAWYERKRMVVSRIGLFGGGRGTRLETEGLTFVFLLSRLYPETWAHRSQSTLSVYSSLRSLECSTVGTRSV